MDFSDTVLGTSDTFRGMFLNVERDSMKGTKRMKRIGPVAAKLVRNPIELVAAANQEARHEFAAGRSEGEGAASPRRAPTEDRRNGMGKDRGTMKAPVSDARGVVRRTTDDAGGVASVASLPNMSRSMATVYSTAPHRESFPRSAVVIDLCMWKEAHVRSNSLTGALF